MDKAITIRRARPGDLTAVDAVEAASFSADRFARRNLARLLKAPSAEVRLAEANGAPLGYVLLLFRRGAGAARLYSLATSPEARGRGVARALVRAAAQCAIERGADRLRLEVRRSNAAAIRLYEGAGFRLRKILPDYYADGETALQMEMTLDRKGEARR